MKRDIIKAIKAVLCALIIDACGGTLGGNPEATTPDTTTPAALTFSLTDAPVEDARHVYISVESVQIAQTGDAWITIPLKEEAEIDLLALQDGQTTVLAAIDALPAGTYGQTRLVLPEETPGRLIDKDGNEHELLIPSGSESGLKIQTAFTKLDGVPLALTIDFDLRKSIKSLGGGNSDNSGKGNKGKYMLKPVLRLIDDSKSGSTSGEVESGSIVCVYANGSTKDATDDCDNAISSATVKNGKYKLSFLDPGLYDLRVFLDGSVVKDIEDVLVTSDKKHSLRY